MSRWRPSPRADEPLTSLSFLLPKTCSFLPRSGCLGLTPPHYYAAQDARSRSTMNKSQVTWLLIRLAGHACVFLGILKMLEAGFAISLRLTEDSTMPLLPFLVGTAPGFFVFSAGVYLITGGQFIFKLLIREDSSPRAVSSENP